MNLYLIRICDGLKISAHQNAFPINESRSSCTDPSYADPVFWQEPNVKQVFAALAINLKGAVVERVPVVRSSIQRRRRNAPTRRKNGAKMLDDLFLLLLGNPGRGGLSRRRRSCYEEEEEPRPERTETREWAPWSRKSDSEISSHAIRISVVTARPPKILNSPSGRQVGVFGHPARAWIPGQFSTSLAVGEDSGFATTWVPQERRTTSRTGTRTSRTGSSGCSRRSSIVAMATAPMPVQSW